MKEFDALKKRIAGMQKAEAISVVRQEREMLNVQAHGLRDEVLAMSRLLLDLEGVVPPESRRRGTGYVIGKR